MSDSNVTQSLVPTRSSFIEMRSIPNVFCGIYWDIENVRPRLENGQTAGQFIKLVREKVHQKRLKEVEFVCVSGRGVLSRETENLIRSSGVETITVSNDNNSADGKLIECMSRFVKNYGPGCNIVLISGDSDYVKFLVRCRRRFDVKIYLIHGYPQSEAILTYFLDAIANEVHINMSDGQLRPVTKSRDVAVVNLSPPPEVLRSPTVRDRLLSLFGRFGAIDDSIYLENRDGGHVCWIGFPSKEMANKAVDELSGKKIEDPLLKGLKFVQYPPIDVIRQLTNGRAQRPVREDTLSALGLLNSRLITSSQSSLTPSTLSLVGKSIPVYLIVTGFPDNWTTWRRIKYLADLLGISTRTFASYQDYITLRVYHIYRAKEYLDKIHDSNSEGFKLTATVEKRLPGFVRFPSIDSEHYLSLFSIECIGASLFVLLVLIIVAIIMWFKYLQ